MEDSDANTFGGEGDVGASAVQVPQKLAGSVKLRLFLMLRYALASSRLPLHLDAHLDWMLTQEKLERIFLSGPVSAAGEGGLIGLTVLRADTLSAAHEIAAADPFVVEGCVRVEIFEWTALEGCLQVSISLSDSVGGIH